MSATIEKMVEDIGCGYIVAAGNPNVILCERNSRLTASRNTLDLSVVPVYHYTPADYDWS